MGVFPSATKIRIAILKKLKNDQTREKNEMLKILAKHFGLSLPQFAMKNPDGRNKWDHRVRWELSWLRKRNLIKNTRPGHFHITSFGKDILQLCESYKRQND